MGKTSVAQEVSQLLEDAGTPHAFIDIDALGWCYPRPADDRFNEALALRNLAAVWATYRRAGAQCLVLAQVIEQRVQLERYRSSTPGADITLIRLQALQTILLERVSLRELGAGQDWHLQRALELATLMEESALEDYLIETEGRSVGEIATEILERSYWPGVLGALGSG